MPPEQTAHGDRVTTRGIANQNIGLVGAGHSCQRHFAIAIFYPVRRSDVITRIIVGGT
jgi:hypothetical protein